LKLDPAIAALDLAYIDFGTYTPDGIPATGRKQPRMLPPALHIP
jgi:hypothetical protein